MNRADRLYRVFPTFIVFLTISVIMVDEIIAIIKIVQTMLTDGKFLVLSSPIIAAPSLLSTYVAISVNDLFFDPNSPGVKIPGNTYYNTQKYILFICFIAAFIALVSILFPQSSAFYELDLSSLIFPLIQNIAHAVLCLLNVFLFCFYIDKLLFLYKDDNTSVSVDNDKLTSLEA